MGYFALPHSTTIFMILFLARQDRHSYLSPEGSLKACEHPVQFCVLCSRTVIKAMKERHDSQGAHHWTSGSLAASVKAGCRVCSTVWEQRKGLKRDFLGYIMFWKPVTSWEASILGFAIISEEPRGETSGARCGFKLVSLEATDIASQPLSNNTGSYASLQQAAKWLEICRINHTQCRNKTVPYMTLSHCWGGGSPLRLAKATLSAFQQSIDIKKLPKTFLQAAQMAKYLGCSYLWIDSLCIIQDDRDDWLQEAALMGNGCLYLRNPRAIQPEPCNSILIVSKHHVLYTRGWVLQEVILAPRVLHCCREQLYWHCDELRASEIFPNGMPASISEDYHPVTKYRSFSNGGKRTILTSSALEKVASNLTHYAGSLTAPRWIEWKLKAGHPFTYWARLVQAYCSMSFTKAEDRAAAFSGIVSLLRPYLGNYLVGVWKISLPFELLWVAVKPSNRQKALRVPSWSWMSIDGAVEYSRCGHSVQHDQILVELLSVWEMRLRGKLAVGDYKHRGNRLSKRVHIH
ncbi:heterokaryon incompatibility protein [Trichoderma velutinum]